MFDGVIVVLLPFVVSLFGRPPGVACSQTLVVNMLMAPIMLDETLSRVDVLATAVIVVGTVLSVAFGSKESKERDIEECTPLPTLRCSVHCVRCVM